MSTNLLQFQFAQKNHETFLNHCRTFTCIDRFFKAKFWRVLARATGNRFKDITQFSKRPITCVYSCGSWEQNLSTSQNFFVKIFTVGTNLRSVYCYHVFIQIGSSFFNRTSDVSYIHSFYRVTNTKIFVSPFFFIFSVGVEVFMCRVYRQYIDVVLVSIFFLFPYEREENSVVFFEDIYPVSTFKHSVSDEGSLN